jgi:hypothetical protein
VLLSPSITGIRSWIVRISAFAAHVMIVKVRAGRVGPGYQLSKKPAK